MYGWHIGFGEILGKLFSEFQGHEYNNNNNNDDILIPKLFTEYIIMT